MFELINPTDFELIGVWNGVSLLEGAAWYSKETNQLCEKVTGTHQQVLFFVRDGAEHLHFSKKYLRELEEYWEKTPQKDALELLEAFYGRQSEIVGKIRRAAIVTENGGITSHAAIISREFNVPCIVGFRGAVEKFGGKIIKVDATSGKISLLHGSHAAG